jgi:lipoic acid synthetase
MQDDTGKNIKRKRLPEWLRMERASGKNYSLLKNISAENNLHTICKSGNCPNIGECWNAGTATFMILGDICTRSCKFCGVKTGKPQPPDKNEPLKLAQSIQKLNLKHAVITSVDRDDLADGGASFWAETICQVKELNPLIKIEALIPDFDGDHRHIQKIIAAGANVISHNIETVRRLTPKIRSKARYDRSLDVIGFIAEQGRIAKSGIMLGLGEREEEVYECMDDLSKSGCRVLTIGQYLQPAFSHMPVVEYISPGQFMIYQKEGLRRGFTYVESSPLVRSSYHAGRHVNA